MTKEHSCLQMLQGFERQSRERGWDYWPVRCPYIVSPIRCSQVGVTSERSAINWAKILLSDIKSRRIKLNQSFFGGPKSFRRSFQLCFSARSWVHVLVRLRDVKGRRILPEGKPRWSPDGLERRVINGFPSSIPEVTEFLLSCLETGARSNLRVSWRHANTFRHVLSNYQNWGCQPKSGRASLERSKMRNKIKSQQGSRCQSPGFVTARFPDGVWCLKCKWGTYSICLKCRNSWVRQ